MKLSVKIPLLIGAVVLATSLSIGFAAVGISSAALERTIKDAIGTTNESNAELISTRLRAQLDVIGDLAHRTYIRNMDWELAKPVLISYAPLIGAIDLAMATPDGISRYAIDNTPIEIHDRQYFMRAMAGEKNIEVVFSRLSSTIVVLFAVPIFQSEEPDAPVVGVLVARKDGGQTLSNLVVSLRTIMASGYSFLMDNEGTIIAHRNTDFVMNQFNPITEVRTDDSLTSFANLVATALVTRTGTSRYDFRGISLIGNYTEVPGFPWLLFTSVEKSEVDRELAGMRYIILAIGAAFMIVGLFIAFLIGRSIAKPVVKMAETLREVGKGDLTRRIVISSKDEIGDFSHNFNTTLDSITNLVLSIKNEAGALSGISDNLSVKMSDTAASVNDINSNIQNIKGRVLNQSASVTQTHATMEKVVGNINKLNDHVENQSCNISQASSAIEQMVANVRSVTGSLVKNAENVKILIEASEVGRSGLSNVAVDIQEISRDSEGLLEINAVMKSIASQTNLLSMNAAIEAAHAGEAGKGFAVVADEIRKLAENSASQSKTIGMVLKKIKGSIDKITCSTENVMSNFAAIDTSVKVVAEHEESIRNAMEEQEHGSKQTLQGVSNVSEITQQVQSGSQEMLGGAKEVIQESENLGKATQEITSSMNAMASGAEQINEAVNRVNEISVMNREGIAVLVREVSRFKVA